MGLEHSSFGHSFPGRQFSCNCRLAERNFFHLAFPALNISTGINSHDGIEQSKCFLLWTLKRIAANDRPETSPVTDALDFLQHSLLLACGTSRKNNDAPSVECALHNMTDALCESLNGNVFLFIYFFGRDLFNVSRRQLHLDNMGAKLGRNVCGIAADIDGRFSLFT